MAQPSPTTTVTNPRIAKLIELEVGGRIKPEHQNELDTYRAQGLAPKKTAASSTESERTAAFLGSNVGTSMLELEEIGKRNPSALRPYIGAQILGGDKSIPGNWANDPDRRQASGAQDLLLDAALTLGTGAAYNKEQFENYKSAYLPGVFDDEATIEAKSRRMRALLEAAKTKAGGSASDIDKAMAAFGYIVAPPKTETLGLREGAERMIDQAAGLNDGAGGVRVDIDGSPANTQSPEFRAGLEALLNSNAPKQQILDYWDKNAPGALKSGADPMKAGPMATDRGKDGIVENADAVVRGIADTATLGFADELAAAGDTIFGDGTMAENLRKQRAVDRYDENVNPYARGAGQFAGAIIPVGVGAIGTGAKTAKEMGAVGGGLGALYGIGSGETAQDRLAGGVKSGLAGAAGGMALGKLSDLYLNRAPRPPSGGGRAQEAADLAQASDDLRVNILPADAGGPTTRLLTSAFGATPGGVQPIVSGARRVQQQAGDALDRMAAKEGPSLTKEGAGEVVTAGALKYRSQSRDAIGRQYERAEKLAGDARVEPNRALETLDRSIAELSEVPGGADGLKVLSELRDDLAQRGTVSVQGIRGMRTQLRQKFLKDGLRGSDVERRVNEAIDAASEDLASSLFEQGRDEAANVYIAADRQWAERVKTLDDVIMPIIGKKGEKSGEQVVDALNAAARGNNARLTKLFEALPTEEAGAARATLINQLGLANPGAQGAKGGEFSLDTFLTRWNSIGPSAKNAIFRGENRKAIDQLALIAEKAKAAGKFRNASNTGLVVTAGMTGATAFSSIFTMGQVLAAQYAGGRLLASPHVARALLGIAKAQNPAAVRARVAGLSAAAAKDPTIRNEVIQLQQRLTSAFNDNTPNVGSAVASDEKRTDQK